MRTTFDLPDDLFMALKRHALELHQPLRVLVEAALRRELGFFSLDQKKQKSKPIRWVSGSADAPDFDISNRESMFDWFQGQS